MKLFSKPISSPSRGEKFPPPLMRFLRSSGGNRSRGRSRSSPMFIRKKIETANETQEPSSPKVTCMGQVRVRKSKRTIAKTARTNTKSRCRWIRNDLFCNCFDKKQKPRTSRPFWRRWFVFFQVGHRRKVEIVEKPPKRERKREEIDQDDHDDEQVEEETVKVFVSSSPPKNALLMMRCRSEPHRASSLANRFWGSPSTIEYAEQQQPEHKSKDEENPKLKNDFICRDSLAEPRTSSEIEKRLGFCEEFESSSNENNTRSTKMEENIWKNGEGSPVRPLRLTRCKSVPEIRSEKLDPDICFWKKRLGFVDISTPPHVFN